MEIGVGLDRGLGLSWDQYRELGRNAASLGYQSVWTNAANGRDSLHVCAQWSVATADVVPGGIGTGVSVIPIGYWSPASLASSAATVGEISGGKFVLGVGSGRLECRWRQRRKDFGLYAEYFIGDLRGVQGTGDEEARLRPGFAKARRQ